MDIFTILPYNATEMKSSSLLFFMIIAIETISCERSIQAPKTIIIGIDGADWQNLMPLINRGYLPNFGYLMENGSWGHLKSCCRLSSPSIWTTIATGKLPLKHGIVDYYVDGSHIRCKTVWEILSRRAGLKVGIAYWLVSWPPPEGTIFTIPGWLTLHNRTYPEDLMNYGKMSLKVDAFVRGNKNEINRVNHTLTLLNHKIKQFFRLLKRFSDALPTSSNQKTQILSMPR
jgi:predicted AlkP superfamily phosphohydrolase/phosphomutase